MGLADTCDVRNAKEQTYWTVVVLLCIVAPIVLTVVSYFGLVQQIDQVRRSVSTIGTKSNGKCDQNAAIRPLFAQNCRQRGRSYSVETLY